MNFTFIFELGMTCNFAKTAFWEEKSKLLFSNSMTTDCKKDNFLEYFIQLSDYIKKCKPKRREIKCVQPLKRRGCK